MSDDRTVLIRHIDETTGRLLETVAGLSNTELRADSLCPGWSRGHVLTHVARSGDALSNLLAWARTSVETPAYDSQEARDADIEAGSGRGPAELLTDLRATASRFAAEVTAMPDNAWQFELRIMTFRPFPAEQVLTRRLAEIVLHHTDLDIGFTESDWPRYYAELELPEPLRSQREDRRS